MNRIGTTENRSRVEAVPPSCSFERLSPELYDRGVDIGSALRAAKIAKIVSEHFNPSEIPVPLIEVFCSRLPASLIPTEVASAIHQDLVSFIRVLGTTFGRPLYSLPHDGGLLVFDLDLLVSDQKFGTSLPPAHRCSSSMILAHLMLEGRFDENIFAQQSRFSRSEGVDLIDTIAHVADGNSVSRQTQSPIEHIAFPTQRDCTTLRRCIESYLRSLRMFNHTPPTLWVFDDADAQDQAAKKEMCNEVAKQWGVSIRHIGVEEKRRFYSELLHGLPESEQAIVHSLCFEEGRFGSNRNFIQLFFSGKVYSTVDDDSTSETTIRNPTEMRGVLTPLSLQSSKVVLATVKTVSNFLKANISDEQVRDEFYKIAMLLAATAEALPSKGVGMAPFVLLQYSRLVELARSYLSIDERRQFKEELVSALDGQFKEQFSSEGVGEEGDEVVRVDECHGIELGNPADLVTLFVDAFGVHSKLVGMRAEDARVLKVLENAGRGISVRHGDPIAAGSIGIVSSNINVDGAGSQQNSLSMFVIDGNGSALKGVNSRRVLNFPGLSVLSDKGRISTTTFTTIDLRNKEGLIRSGNIDSSTLGWSIQSGDPTCKFMATPLALNHLRVPSKVRKLDPIGIGEGLVHEVIESLATQVVFDNLSYEEALRKASGTVLHALEGVGRLWSRTQQPRVKEQCDLIVTGVGRGLDINVSSVMGVVKYFRNLLGDDKGAVPSREHSKRRKVNSRADIRPLGDAQLKQKVLEVQKVRELSRVLHSRAKKLGFPDK